MAVGFGPRLYHMRGSVVLPASNFAANRVAPLAGRLRYHARRRMPVIIRAATVLVDDAITALLKIHLFGRPLVTSSGIGSISVAGAGNMDEYDEPPLVTIAAPAGGGGVARARAVLNDSGQIASFVVTEPGYGYISAPAVTVAGSATGTAVLAQTLETPSLDAFTVPDSLMESFAGNVTVAAWDDIGSFKREHLAYSLQNQIYVPTDEQEMPMIDPGYAELGFTVELDTAQDLTSITNRRVDVLLFGETQ